MRLTAQRLQLDPQFTIGEFLINGNHEAWTMEDTVRAPGVKVPHQTAIPYGTYKVVKDFSNRFQRDTLHILGVPGFAGIRIHKGNRATDTEGCILVGLARYPSYIANCEPALEAIESKVFAALDAGEEVTLEITQPQPGEVIA